MVSLCDAASYNSCMAAIRATFDGKVFVPDQPVNIPPHSPAIVIIDDQAEQAEIDRATREYYLAAGAEADDDWPDSAAHDSKGAWDED
jgi:hypothetical protein